MILEEYDANLTLNHSFCNKMELLIKELIASEGLRIHSISSRVKDRASLDKKVNNANGKYNNLGEITDIVGIRIITFFQDEVNEVADIIKSEFEIDADNSIDKRELLDPDRFGYLSLHYIVKLHNTRLDLFEYKKFHNCYAEVQIRSILQHTWAEIEHDLGYKSKVGIPKDIRRSFSRLAGLLELADLEFSRIRDSIFSYEEHVLLQIGISPHQIEVDKASLKAYISTSKFVESFDKQICKIANCEFKGGDLENDHLDQYVGILFYFGIKNIEDLNSILTKYLKTVIEFGEGFLIDKSKGGYFEHGICIFYLGYVLAAKDRDLDSIYKYLQECNVGGKDKRKLAVEVLEVYKVIFC